VPVFYAAWTVFAAGVAWWLIASAGSDHIQPQLLFDSGRVSQIPVREQIRQWLRIADLNFRGAYPWLLLAPYVFWLGSHFLLERGRLRVSLPVHVLACALFASASYALTTHGVEKMRVVMVLSDRRAAGPLPGEHAGHGGIATVETTIADNSIRIHSFTSNVSGSSGRLITSSDGKVETFELPPPTGDSAGATGVGVASRIITNFPEIAKSIAISADEEIKVDMGRHASPAFSSMRSSWRYESRLISNVLNIFAYGSLAGLAHAVHFYRRSRERDRRAVLLESHLTKARLSALQAQLQPHFLFNALNAVATLLRRDARAAQEALTSFSELLRLALSQSDKPEVPLSEDLLFLDRYVEIQQTRLGERFRFEQEVEPSTLDCLVPAVLLQPLVENALRHGIEQSSNPGLVRVVVKKLERRLVLSVEDNGVGLGGTGNPPGTGIGLSNLRARLEALYGVEQMVELVGRPEGGVAVRVEIPFRLANARSEKDMPESA